MRKCFKCKRYSRFSKTKGSAIAWDMVNSIQSAPRRAWMVPIYPESYKGTLCLIRIFMTIVLPIP